MLSHVKRQIQISLVFSAALHALILGVFSVNRSPPAPQSTLPPPIEVRMLSALPGSGIPAQTQRKSSSKLQKETTVDVKKLFALTDASTIRPLTSPTEGAGISADVEAQVGSSGEGELAGLQAWEASASHPFWPQFSERLHGRLKFPSNLYELHNAGKVYVSLRFKTDGSLDPQSVRSQSDMKYLQVYVLREICEEFCAPNPAMAQLIANRSPGIVRLKISFVAGQRGDYSRDPQPRMKPHALDIERRLRVSSLQVGAANLFGSGSSNGSSSFNLGLPFEVESLFSSSHRKRFGWSGAKAHDELKRVMKKDLDRLYDEYKQLGWI